MQINMKCNYPAWKWAATQFLLPFLWGILQEQTFRFQSLIEDGTSHSPRHISSPQKLLFIVDCKIASLPPTESPTERSARFSVAEACWRLTDEQNLSASRGWSPGCPCCDWQLGVSALTGQVVEVFWLGSSWRSWWLCRGCWLVSGLCPELVGLGCYLSFCFWRWVLSDITLLQPLVRKSGQDWLHSLRLALQSPLSPQSYGVVVANPQSLVGLYA